MPIRKRIFGGEGLVPSPSPAPAAPEEVSIKGDLNKIEQLLNSIRHSDPVIFLWQHKLYLIIVFVWLAVLFFGGIPQEEINEIKENGFLGWGNCALSFECNGDLECGNNNCGWFIEAGERDGESWLANPEAADLLKDNADCCCINNDDNDNPEDGPIGTCVEKPLKLGEGDCGGLGGTCGVGLECGNSNCGHFTEAGESNGESWLANPLAQGLLDDDSDCCCVAGDDNDDGPLVGTCVEIPVPDEEDQDLKIGEGDCDLDSDCGDGLDCGDNNCRWFINADGSGQDRWEAIPGALNNSNDNNDCCCIKDDDELGGTCLAPGVTDSDYASNDDYGRGYGSCDADTCDGDLECGVNNCSHPNFNNIARFYPSEPDPMTLGLVVPDWVARPTGNCCYDPRKWGEGIDPDINISCSDLTNGKYDIDGNRIECGGNMVIKSAAEASAGSTIDEIINDCCSPPPQEQPDTVEGVD